MEEETKTIATLVDDSHQEFMLRYYQFSHLSRRDAKVEWLAWLLLVLGLCATAILQTG